METNFFFALSNPCFELWLLLHLKDLTAFSPQEQQHIFENKKIKKRSKRTYLKNLLNDMLTDGYHEKAIKPERFLPNIDDAISRAKALNNSSAHFPTGIGTDVYKLVEKLIKP